MNKLEVEIREYLIDTDISNMSVMVIASRFFVSRALVYKVLNKMGYNSLSTLKQEKELNKVDYNSRIENVDIVNADVIDRLIIDMNNANILYIVGFYGSELVAEYMMRQLVNLGYIAIAISDKYQLKGYKKLIQSEDILVFVSNTGLDEETLENFTHLNCCKYVVTQTNSKLYLSIDNHIGVNNYIGNLAARFERENTIELLKIIQLILNKLQNYKEENNENSIDV